MSNNTGRIINLFVIMFLIGSTVLFFLSSATGYDANGKAVSLASRRNKINNRNNNKNNNFFASGFQIPRPFGLMRNGNGKNTKFVDTKVENDFTRTSIVEKVINEQLRKQQEAEEEANSNGDGTTLAKQRGRLIRRLINTTSNSIFSGISFTTELLSDLNEPYLGGIEEPSSKFHIAKPDVTHFCFLQHGHRGYGKDLAYLQTTMKINIEKEKRKRYDKEVGNNEIMQDVIVHTVTCNEQRTDDGIMNGGSRLADEMIRVIRKEMNERFPVGRTNGEEKEGIRKIHNVTISLVGNSLGGLYSRYAIAELVERCSSKTKDRSNCTASSASSTTIKTNDQSKSSDYDDDDDTELILDGKYRIHFNVFCTTASPHLGLKKNTYLPLPRNFEMGIAYALGETGRDLFRLNDLIWNMSTSSTFLDPLSSFKKRIAYANAYGTDFPVPTETAAFLHDKSTSPHHFDDINNENVFMNNIEIEENLTSSNLLFDEGRKEGAASYDDDEVSIVDDNGLIIATLHTPKTRADNFSITRRDTYGHQRIESGDNNGDTLNRKKSSDAVEEEQNEDNDIITMSESLDSLGWKKVFVDLRKDIPIGVSIPKNIIKRASSYVLSSASSDGGKGIETETDDDQDQQQQQKNLRSIFPSSVKGKDETEKREENKDQNDVGSCPPKSSLHSLKRSKRGILHSKDVVTALASTTTSPTSQLATASSSIAPNSASKRRRVSRQLEKSTSLPTSGRIDKITTKYGNFGNLVDSGEGINDDDDNDNFYRITLPLGHNMICAFSRSRLSSYLNRGGRPVVDSLAKELVDDIFMWK